MKVKSPYATRIADTIIPGETYYLLDSMPLEVCRLSRAKRSRICCECPELVSDFGYCAAHK